MKFVILFAASAVTAGLVLPTVSQGQGNIHSQAVAAVSDVRTARPA